MELIFFEWLGINGIEKINDTKVIAANEKFWRNKWEQEHKDGNLKYIDRFKEIFNYYKSDFKDYEGLESKIRKKNQKRTNQEDKDILTLEIKGLISNEIGAYVTSIFSNLNLENFNFEVLDQINAAHQTNLKNQGVDNPNPICKIFKYNGEYCVETYQYVAEFEIPLKDKKKGEALKIKILPRDLVTEKGFERMIESIFNISPLGSISGVRSANSFLILYYMAFLRRLKDVLSKGIHREYVEMEENLHFLKERLLIPEHVRLNHFNKHKLFCGFTEFSPDNVINQTIISTLNLISKSKFSGNNYLTSSVRNIQNNFGDVEIARDFKPSVFAFDKISYNRQNERYREIMGYCRNIIQNLGGAFGNDTTKYTAFYLDMSELFEQYVGKLLKDKNLKDLGWDGNFKWNDDPKNSEECNVELQYNRKYLDDEAKMFNIRPDILVFNSSGDPIAVADTKYKRLTDKKSDNYNISSADIYQVMAYAEKFKVEKMYLIYPKPNEDWKDILPFTINNKTLFIKTVDLQKDTN